MKIITVLVLDGVFDSSLSITLDTLHAAQSIFAARGGAPKVQVRTIAAKAYITTGAGMRMKADLQLKAAQHEVSDWIIVPGLGHRSDQQLGDGWRAAMPCRRCAGWLRRERARPGLRPLAVRCFCWRRPACSTAARRPRHGGWPRPSARVIR